MKPAPAKQPARKGGAKLIGTAKRQPFACRLDPETRAALARIAGPRHIGQTIDLLVKLHLESVNGATK